MTVTEDIRYIGVNDHEIDLFEGMYEVPAGMAYNSYVILDEKIAVVDTVEQRFIPEWMGKLEGELGGRVPDYLIVQHMEPDHSAGITAFLHAYPQAVVVASAPAFGMMRNYFKTDFADRRVIVRDGDSLSLGAHELQLFAAPMVHWPEVIVTYDAVDKTLFSADAFGKFGALDVEEDWACEARRYYFGIVGRFGMQVQKLLSKLAALDIQTICPLHGPVLKENTGYYIDLYNTWSSYDIESEGVVIAYTSVYGNTKQAAELLAEELRAGGAPKVVLQDLARTDMAEAVEDAFRYGKLVLATTTYNADIFPFMRTFIENLTERGYCRRTIALMENGSWAPMAARVMKSLLAECKEITFAETTVRISATLDETSRGQIRALASELCGG